MSTPAVDWVALVDDGRISLLEALASVDEATRPSGDRALVLRLASELSLDVFPDRGLDMGAAWWGGAPIAWRSPHLVDPGPAGTWENHFLGGLLATCGPDNIGPSRGTSGQHGSHHLSRAQQLRWWRRRTDQEIDVRRVRDVVRNSGDGPIGVPLLYHVNLGAPALHPGARGSSSTPATPCCGNRARRGATRSPCRRPIPVSMPWWPSTETCGPTMAGPAPSSAARVSGTSGRRVDSHDVAPLVHLGVSGTRRVGRRGADERAPLRSGARPSPLRGAAPHAGRGDPDRRSDPGAARPTHPSTDPPPTTSR